MVSACESASKTAQETMMPCPSKDSKIRVSKKLEELGPLPALHRPSYLSSDHKLCIVVTPLHNALITGMHSPASPAPAL